MENNAETRPKGEFLVFQGRGLGEPIQVRLEGETVWLSQKLLAELYGTSVPNINQHISSVYEDEELLPEATIKKYLIVQTEGSRQIKRLVDHYNLDMILAVGFRVRSKHGSRSRQWATRHLAEYLRKGFVMDDERLKNPGGWDYFDELLERIREIRASEKRFYQKVHDLFALSSDYADNPQFANLFFAEVQNKLLYAVTHHTAAELVVERADPASPNMSLMSWSGSRIRKQDVTVTKNYLSTDEIDTLNRLVVIFLEQAELRVKERKQLTLEYWRGNIDRMLEFNEKAILDGKGNISHEAMQTIAHERYEEFDSTRRLDEARQADADDLAELEQLEKALKSGKDEL